MARSRTPLQFAALASIGGIVLAVIAYVIAFGNTTDPRGEASLEEAAAGTAAQRSVSAAAESTRVPREQSAHDGTLPAANDNAASTTTASVRVASATSAGVAWPIVLTHAPAERGGKTTADPAVPPAVPVQVAFRALWYLGTDSAAEATWAAAINDPRLPEGVRSDLIIDMIDEGYTDNERPGAADLAVVRARLQILERHAPHAMDEINARAFEQAYREMLQLYQRLVAATSAGR